ncbi:MAG TPA: chemotaxis protein CheW [Terracidiphilus sp.]|nr:chemotaxis protein CheW [Terracidiphilus sp.]
MDEIVKDFLIESGENLDRLDQELVKLEADPKSNELLASIFRTVHTIKGTCGFLGFARLEKVAHAGESLLSRLRDGKLSLTAEVTSGLLAMVDAVRHMLSEIQATEHDGENDYQGLREELKRLQGQEEDHGATSAAAAPASVTQAPAPPAARSAAIRILEVAETAPQPEVSVPPARPDRGQESAEASAEASTKLPVAAAPVAQYYRPAPGKIGGLLVERGSIRPEDLAAALQEQERGGQRSVGEILVSMGACRQEDVLAVQQIIESRGRETGAETVRVSVSLLDRLMNLVGELVLARNQLLQFSNTTQDGDFSAVSQRMNLIATELQEEVMKTRMQPIGNVWNKFPRTVRDLAHSCGKEVRLEMEGQETELDRTIIEAIKDPLTHLVRNAMDHGIEAPEVRKLAGKDATGCLKLRAFHEGGQVNIEISDDGAGLNRERIRKKAVERGLVSAEQAARLPDRDVFNMVFLPGFSTAEKVTQVSGRGVGMDVVKTNVEKIGGMVDIQSTPGEGTTVRVKIPLTLAIIPALIVRCSGERFAIPQVSLTELVRLESGKGIEMVLGSPVYRLRGQLLPLVYLSQTLKPRRVAEDGRPQAVSRGELLDFALAREKHHQWLGRLREVLDGKATMSVEQAGSPRECAVGKWLYGPGLKDYGLIPEMHTLEQTHEHFHERVRAVVAAKAEGHSKEANEAYREVVPLSTKIVDLLLVVENRAIDLKNVNIVVLQAERRQFGLVVDDILDTEEIVVKPLGKQLKGISVYSGATIMGDGRVALILDVLGLAQRVQVIAEARDSTLQEERVETLQAEAPDQHTLLLAENGLEGRVAIPLSIVARLEEFPRTAVERAGAQEVMQYRGQIIPLVRLSEIIPATRDADRLANAGSIQVVVYTEGKRTVGVIVDRIVDIVEQRSEVERLVPRAGVVGSFVVQRQVTDLLDLPAIVRAALPGLLDAPETAAEGT